MWQRNNGQTEAEKLQNRFTAYLLVAVRRQQRDYVIKKNQRIRHELLMEDIHTRRNARPRQIFWMNCPC